MKALLISALTVLFASAADARPRRLLGLVNPAQASANTQAAAGSTFHTGAQFRVGATHEGCGFSTVSAADAIRHCCYWGQRVPVAIGVARGPGGWYATVQYR